MSRSFFFERVRINIEIFCETVSDFMGSFGGVLRKPLMFLAGVAMVMTLRSARKGVQTMKNGGLTAGDSWLGSSKSYGATSNYRSPYQTAATSGYGATGSTSYGTSSYASRGASELGSGSTMGSTSSYGSGSLSSYSSSGASSSYGGGSGGCDGPCRSTASLVSQFDGQVRVMDASNFKDYGGLVGFFGQIETLSALEGSGVVEKVLQSPGNNKVLVIDGGGNKNSAILTKLAVDNAKVAGWKGVIVHGAIQNAAEIQSVAFGVKAMGTYPLKGKATSGSKGSSLSIAGMIFTPHMWVYCDKDGIVLSDNELTPTGSSSSYSASSSMGSTSSTMGGNTGYASGGTQTQPQPGGSSMGMNGAQGSQSLFSSSSTGGNSGGYTRNLPADGQTQGRYDQGGGSYPYSHGGASNPYMYSAAGKGSPSLSIWISVTLSIVTLWQYGLG